MVIRWFDGKLPTSTSLMSRVDDAIARATRALGDRVREVDVLVRDDNGPRGGVDKLCRLVAKVSGARPIVVESRGTDYHSTSLAAVRKLKHALTHRANLAHTHHPHP
ncbi:MAG: hypothetical protein SFZ23_08470 [Planctomycetota bacterium]|nr:hypothetical protein [Planctomycetota bacterium]